MKINYSKNYSLIYFNALDFSWHSKRGFNFLSFLKSCLLTASYGHKKKILFIQEEDIIEAPYLIDYREIEDLRNSDLNLFVSEYFDVLSLIKYLNLETFFFSSFSSYGFSSFLALSSKNRFLGLENFIGSYSDPALFGLLEKDSHRESLVEEKPFIRTCKNFIDLSLAEKIPLSSKELKLSFFEKESLFLNSKQINAQISFKTKTFYHSQISFLYEGNFPFLHFLAKRKRKAEKILDVYIDLNERMLPFKGLLNLLNEGCDLFFFCDNLNLLELRLTALKGYFEEKMGSKKTDFLWKEKIFSTKGKKAPLMAFTISRKNDFFIKIKQKNKAIPYCLLPMSNKQENPSFLAEVSSEKPYSKSSEELAEIFFDSLLKPQETKKEPIFLCLIAHKMVLLELDSLSEKFSEGYDVLISSLKKKGFFLSFSEKHSDRINALLSSRDIKRWIFDSFLITQKKDKKENKKTLFNYELISLHFQVFLTILMILFQKKKYFSTFLESEFYLRQIFSISNKVTSFQFFLAELGEKKFNYLVWQFFPQYLGSISYFRRNYGSIQRKTFEKNSEETK